MARGARFHLVAARFNEPLVSRLVDAALDVLRRRGAAEADLEVTWVPGSFELPLACRWAAERGRCDAVLAFGVLIRGETEHFRLVAESATQGLQQVALATGVPVLNGVLAVLDAEQAAARTGGRIGNRGAEVALAAVRMAALKRAGAAAR
ncbi:MAG: 6,7-dimethyl-8-ribityllumazine synthase [Candidatus Eisenbacteria bacterium]|nr:6,7-dimethyl-8-ribityllumazine synthase [Candidatus Eisenbacteria bacterium]